ncbi:MAG: hypothetical protein ABI559_06625 [Chloroflexota bacterium]
MAERASRASIRLHLQQAQRLVGLITDRVLRIADQPSNNQQLYLTFPGLPADLSGVRLRLIVDEFFRVYEFGSGTTSRHTFITFGYQYKLLDAGNKEILAYHWHPSGPSKAKQPHLHLGSAAQVRQRDLAAAHLPTGLIALTDMVELAIEAFGAEPRTSDWRTVVAEARAAR